MFNGFVSVVCKLSLLLCLYNIFVHCVAGGLLVVSPLTSYYNESSVVSVSCINQNSIFRGSPQWNAPDGSNIDSTRNPVLAIFTIPNVTRHKAGTYTCYVPGVPQVPVAYFELIVNCKFKTVLFVMHIKLMSTL